MSLWPRCGTCDHHIWPWQRMGWFVDQKVTVTWHTKCGRPAWSR